MFSDQSLRMGAEARTLGADLSSEDALQTPQQTRSIRQTDVGDRYQNSNCNAPCQDDRLFRWPVSDGIWPMRLSVEDSLILSAATCRRLFRREASSSRTRQRVPTASCGLYIKKMLPDMMCHPSDSSSDIPSRKRRCGKPSFNGLGHPHQF